MLRRASLHLLCAVFFFGTASLAAAQEGGEPPNVYIVAVPMNDGIDAVATRTGSAARGALRGIEGVEWRRADQLFLGYDDSALSVLQRAREQLEAGRTAYLNLELDQAVEQLEGAVENFDAAAAALEDPNDLGQALLMLGASHAFNGQRRQALVAFRRLHTQMPFIEPDPDTFPPEVIQLYEAARPRGRSDGVISIDSNPQGAIAYVDFLARGRTPINVEGLVAGDHVVRVTRPGATPFVETLEVHRRRAATSNAYLVDSPDLQGLADALDEIPTAPIDQLEEGNPILQVAQMLQLDKLGVIRVSAVGGETVTLELLLFDVASGRRLVRGEQGGVPVAVGELEGVVNRAVTGAFEAALRPTQVADTEDIPAMSDAESPFEPDTPPAAPGRPVTEEWWFWTILGAVAVGALVGIGVGVGVATQGPALGSDPTGQVVFTF